MHCQKSTLGTTSGASEPQRSAGVGGSGVKTGTNVAGPLRSSSSDREGAGVVVQAPATLPTTGTRNRRLDRMKQPSKSCCSRYDGYTNKKPHNNTCGKRSLYDQVDQLFLKKFTMDKSNKWELPKTNTMLSQRKWEVNRYILLIKTVCLIKF
jgi:hypothetical protein